LDEPSGAGESDRAHPDDAGARTMTAAKNPRARLAAGAQLRRMREHPLLKSMVAGIGRARTLGLAAEMSFWMFLALVPLAAIAGFAAARLAAAHLIRFPSSLSVVPPEVRDLLVHQVSLVASWHGGTIAPVAAATFVWVASNGVHAVFDALEVQAGAEPRPWWKKRLLAIGTCVGLSIGLALITVLGAGLDWLGALAGPKLPAWILALVHGPAGHLVRWLVGAVIAVAMEAGLFRVGLPGERRSALLPGAVLAVVLQAVLGWVYGVYVGKLGGSGSAYEAGLAVVGVTLMILWLFSLSLLLGAQLNVALCRARMAEALRPREACPTSAASSSRPTSRRPPTAPSIGPSSSPPASGRPSR
jgi:membrane protein